MSPTPKQERSRPTWRQRATALRKQGWARLRGGELTPWRAGWSVAVGLFIGCIPVFGLHLPLCLAVSLPLRLDAPVAYLAANVSNPLVAPWLVWLEVQAGAYVVTGHAAPFDLASAREVGAAGFAGYAALGAAMVGASLAALGGTAAALVTSWARRAFRRGK